MKIVFITSGPDCSVPCLHICHDAQIINFSQKKYASTIMNYFINLFISHGSA